MHEFIQRIINASPPFAVRKTLPISICNHIICNLDRQIIPSFCKLYPDHAMPHDLDGAVQQKKVQEILAAAQQAEDKVHQVQEIACGITGQSFHYKVPPGTPTAETTATPITIGAYPSQAERTLAKYEGKGSSPSAAKTPYKHIPHKCFGCGAPSHSFQDKDGKIICPYGYDPSVKANAEREYRAYRNRLAKKYKARMAKFCGQGCGRGGRGSGRTSSKSALDYNKLPAEDQKRIRNQVLAAQAAQNTELVFMLMAKLSHATVLASIDAPPCRTLPIEIHSDFPHIIIQLGAILGRPDSPSIRAVIDTAAALTTGNLHLFAKIAKAFPHTVAAVYATKDYTPITLSSIVEQNGESITAELLVAFKFKLPYFTKEGNTTTFMVVVGSNVTVNTILGLPFIKQTKIIVDAADQVAELRALDALPFSISFRRAQCHVPTIDETKVHVNMTQCADIICKINHIESLYSGNSTVQHTTPHPSPKGALLPKKRCKPNNLRSESIRHLHLQRRMYIHPLLASIMSPLTWSCLSATTASVSIVTSSECTPWSSTTIIVFPRGTTIVALFLPFGRRFVSCSCVLLSWDVNQIYVCNCQPNHYYY